jgi:predicted membrane protein
MILIAVGAFIGLRHRFRGGAWLVMMVIGFVFLFDFISPDYSLRRYFWPIVIMVFGLIMILKPKGSSRWRSHHRWRRDNYAAGNVQNEYAQNEYVQKPVQESQFIPVDENKPKAEMPGDYLDSAAVFGGIRKAFFTKDFKGGEAVSVFGGHEIDLSKSDITGTVTLELTQIFGGTKLIIPNNWNVKSEVVAFLGGIEDKRHTDSTLVDPGKILLLKGTSILGGIDIRSY